MNDKSKFIKMEENLAETMNTKIKAINNLIEKINYSNDFKTILSF